MELKGKCLIEFWKWYLLPEQRLEYKTNSLIGSNPAIKIRFLAMSFSERFGVFQDYFDSLEDDTEIRYLPKISRGYKCYFIDFKGILKRYNTRKEARTEAIEKAVELRNEQLNDTI